MKSPFTLQTSLFKLQWRTATVLAALWILCAGALHAQVAVPASGPAISSGCEYGYPPFCMVEESGRANGFSVELLRAALQAINRDVAFRVGPWVEIKGLLERGEIDVLPLVARTPERESTFDFTSPYLSLNGAIVLREGTTDVHNLNDLKGRRVAVMEGDIAEEFVRRTELGFEIHTTPTFDDALRELSGGRHDAVVIQRLLALRLIQEAGITNLWIVGKPLEGFQQDICFAVKEGDREMLSLLNKGLALLVADGTRSRLHAKWLRMTLSTANDPPNSTDKLNGIGDRIVKEAFRRIGMELQIVRLPSERALRNANNGIEDGNYARVGRLVSPLYPNLIQVPGSIVQFEFIAFSKKHIFEPSAWESLSPYHVGIINGWKILEGNIHKTKTLTKVNNADILFKMLEAERIEVAVYDRRQGMHIIKESGLKEIKAMSPPFSTQDMYIYLHKRHQSIVPWLAKVLKQMRQDGTCLAIASDTLREIYTQGEARQANEPNGNTSQGNSLIPHSSRNGGLDID